jgi:hypothetical protein
MILNYPKKKVLSMKGAYIYVYIYMYIYIFDSYTTPSQQVHNTTSHRGGPHTLDSTPCEKVLCTCCGVIVNLSFFIYIYIYIYICCCFHRKKNKSIDNTYDVVNCVVVLRKHFKIISPRQTKGSKITTSACYQELE